MKTLTQLNITGYKSLRDADIALSSLNVFIGANGAGKSNFITVFELLRQIVNRNLATYTLKTGGADALLHFGQKHTADITLALTFTGDQADVYNGYTCRLIPTAQDTLAFAGEECWFTNTRRYKNHPYHIALGTGHRETRLFEASSASLDKNVADHVIQALRSWRVYHFHDTGATAKIKALGDIDDNHDLRDDASNLAAFLYYLQQRHPRHYKQIVATVRLVAPFFADFNLQPNRLNPEKIRLEWQEQGADTYFNAHALSDGTLRFICLATLLQMPDLPTTILIDEPELGLHPYAITLLAALLRSAATRTQIIISTQSVTLVNQFEPQEIVVVNRQDNQSVFERRDPASLTAWLEDYGMGDLWEKNLLGGRPR